MKAKHKKIALLIFIGIVFQGSYLNFNIANSSTDFSNFYDFLDQYNIASSMEKPTILSDYIVWQEITGGGFPAIINDTHVVFIYYNAEQSIDNCNITGDFTIWREKEMIQLDSNISFFYFEYTFEPSSRIDYFFVIDEEWILDPRNPNQSPHDTETNSSELAMPLFEQPTEIIYRESISHGKLEELEAPWSNPGVNVYLPPNYNHRNRYPTIYTGDGFYYINMMSMVNILDNMIADKRIEPVIVVFIDPKDHPDPYARYLWYKCNPDYLTYLDELVYFIDETYSTNQSAYARLHLGFSASGLASAYTVIERPDKFKLLASQSGAFWAGEEYGIKIKYLLASSSLDLRAWFSVGTYENNNSNETPMVNDTQRMAEICRENGWITEEVYNPECHSFGQWRHILDEMLEFFFPYKGSTKKVSQFIIFIMLPLIIIPILIKRKAKNIG